MKKLRHLRLLVGLLLICVGVIGGLWDYLRTAEVPFGAVSTFDLNEQMLPYFRLAREEEETRFLTPTLRRGKGPYFEAQEISGEPAAIVLNGGKVVVEFRGKSASELCYVDPLAIKSEPWGEHPADKVLRLRDRYGLSISRGLEFCLQRRLLKDLFFHRLSFEYLPGKRVYGVVTEIDIAGSFLVIVDPVPKEWQPRGTEYLTPSFFLINRDQNAVAQEKILKAVGFDPDPTVFGPTLFEQIWGIFDYYRGGGLNSIRWFTQQLRQLGVALDPDLEIAGGFVVLGDEVYLTASDGFWRDATKGKVFRLNPDGSLTELFQAPGEILLALPNPWDPDRWLISAEGYPKDDPRFQSFFEVNLQTSEWRVIEFPEPPDYELYATSARYSPDGRVLFMKRYGFIDEGGGIWVMDLTDPDYTAKKKLISWDHMLSWIPLGSLTRRLPSKGPSEGMFPLVITAKEVERGFAMTVSRAIFQLAGMNSEIVDMQQLGKMVGWSPAPIHIGRMGGGRYRVYIEIAYNFEAYMESGPFAIYVVDLQE